MTGGNGDRGLGPLIAAAEKTLGERFGSSVRLDRDQPLGGSERSKVVRCRILEGPREAPASIIIKHVPGDADHPYDPDRAPSFSPAWRFFNDWTGAQFLSAVTGDDPL